MPKKSIETIDDHFEDHFKFMGWKTLKRDGGYTEKVTYYKCKHCGIHVGRDYREEHYLAIHSNERI